MIDVWMIFTMMYPFAVVTLYAIKEVIQKKISYTNEGLYTQYLQTLSKVCKMQKLKVANLSYPELEKHTSVGAVLV